jgi:type I restriction enzyme S subunit
MPEGWKVMPLSAVASRIMVGIASAATFAYRAEGIPMFRNQNIRPGRLDDSDLLFLDPAYELRYRNKRLQPGDLLTARTGYPGTTALVPSDYRGAQSFTTLITRPDSTEVNSAYLCYFINSNLGQRFVEHSQIGGAQKNLNAGSLRKMPIWIAPKGEQKAIATALSEMDDLIAITELLLAKKRAIKQGMMQELLTGRTRLPGFLGNWVQTTVGDVVRIQRGAMLTRAQAGHGTVPVVAGGKRPAGFTDRPNRMGRTVTISASGASAGYVAMYRNPIFASDCSTISHANGYDLDFIYYSLILRQEDIFRAQTGGAQPHIRARDINPMSLDMPVAVDEQLAIGGVLAQADSELDALERRLEATRAIKQGMMQELLTGHTRLPADKGVTA